MSLRSIKKPKSPKMLSRNRCCWWERLCVGSQLTVSPIAPLKKSVMLKTILKKLPFLSDYQHSEVLQNKGFWKCKVPLTVACVHCLFLHQSGKWGVSILFKVSITVMFLCISSVQHWFGLQPLQEKVGYVTINTCASKTKAGLRLSWKLDSMYVCQVW